MDVLLDNIILPKSLFDSLVSADKSVLVLDIGATQTRLALFSPDLQYCPIGLYKTSEVISVEDVIAGYLHNLGIQETAVDTIALGVAGKIDYLAGYVKMTKSNIEVSRSAIQKRFKATTCLKVTLVTTQQFLQHVVPDPVWVCGYQDHQIDRIFLGRFQQSLAQYLSVYNFPMI